MAESQRQSLVKRVQAVKIYYETKNSRETARRLNQQSFSGLAELQQHNCGFEITVKRRFEDSGCSVGEIKRQLPKPVRTGSTEERVLAAACQTEKGIAQNGAGHFENQ